MTKRRKKREKARPLAVVPRPQVRCGSCGRYYAQGGACWVCEPPEPAHCHCDDLTKCHLHIDHWLFGRLWQLDLESVDEEILLDTLAWSDEVPGRRQQAWRDDPEFKAWKRRFPQLRERSRRGVASMWAYFGLNDREGALLDRQAIGYTVDAMAQEFGIKAGGVDALLASAWSKVRATIARNSGDIATAV